jgi:hypothetical protein
MKAILETRRAHYIRYLRFSYTQQTNTHAIIHNVLTIIVDKKIQSYNQNGQAGFKQDRQNLSHD